MDATEPPRIVFENQDACADPARVEGELRASLATARAPAGTWIVSVSFVRPDADGIHGRAAISVTEGVEFAHRSLWNWANDCDGLARALGVWASLVLEAEVARGSAAAGGGSGPSPLPPPRPSTNRTVGSPGEANANEGEEGVEEGASRAARGSSPAGSWPGGGITGSPLPGSPSGVGAHGQAAAPATSTSFRPALTDRVADASPQRAPSSPRVEVTGGAFVMAGATDAVVGGFTLDATVLAYRGVYIRPAVFVGQTWAPDPKHHLIWTMATGRADVCARLIPWPKTQPSFEVDPCAGVEVGALRASGMGLPISNAGPSVDVRHRFGNGLAALVRATGGIDTLGDFSPSGRLELALACGLW